MRPARRLLVVLVLTAAILSGSAVSASAEPSTPDRRQVATSVAKGVCKAFPSLPFIPDKIEPRGFCEKIVVENVDPEGSNKGVRETCVAMLPLAAKPFSKQCVQAVDKLLDPARKIFLDKVVPAVEKAKCAATAAAGNFDCVADQVHLWLKEAIVSLWADFTGHLTAPTAALSIIDFTQAGQLTGSQSAFKSVFADVGWLGASIVFVLFMVAIIRAVVNLDPRSLGTSAVGVVSWGLFWVIGVTLCVLLLKVSDQLAVWAAGAKDASGQTPLDGAAAVFGKWLDYVSGASENIPGGVHPVYNPGSLVGVLICLILLCAILAAVIILTLRNVGIVIMVLMWPILLAGQAGPPATREWLPKAARAFIAIALAKPLMVLCCRLGSVFLDVPKSATEPQASASTALLGAVLILVAAFVPGIFYKLSGVMPAGSAGSRAGAGGAGAAEQAGHSTMSAVYSTQQLARSNAPKPLTVGGAGGGGGTTPGGVGAWHGGRGPATANPATAGRGGLGAAGGVAGLAVMAGTTAAGAASSATRSAASQVGTAGGALDDVEPGHVPSAPYMHGMAGGGGGGPQQPGPAQDRPTGQQTTPAPQPARTSVSQIPAGGASSGQGPVLQQPEPRAPIPPAPKAGRDRG